MRRPRAAWALLVAAALLGPAAALAQEPAAPVGAAPAAASSAEAPAREPVYLAADLVITELDGEGAETVKRMRLHKLGNKVRTVAELAEGDRFVGDTLYDYDRGEYFRKLADQDITFSYRMLTRDRVRAQIFGFMDKPADDPEFRVKVNDDVPFDGHSCTLSLVGFPAAGRIHALHWVWQANDLDGAVVRVVFPEDYDHITIVEYLGASAAPFDPAAVQLPPDTVVMSAF
ncbi:MAG: hypothetical protein HZA24_07875 [Nitrospirae bacterium]|nr:hypothetical protein [Nitrospirota bacterium]